MITITKGEKAVFDIKLRDELGDPYDMSGFDEYKVCLPTGSGGTLEITQNQNANGSVVSSISGETYQGLNVTVGSTDSATLTEEDRLSISVELNNAATPNPKRAVLRNALNVESFCG